MLILLRDYEELFSDRHSVSLEYVQLGKNVLEHTVDIPCLRADIRARSLMVRAAL